MFQSVLEQNGTDSLLSKKWQYPATYNTSAGIDEEFVNI